MKEKINYGGWPNCIRLSNDKIDLIVTTDIGPRIIRFGFSGKQNFFYLSADDSGRTGDDHWRMYGGHRLWLAPEAMPFSYYPDNDPIAHTWDGTALTLIQAEATTGIVKEIRITLDPHNTEAVILHRINNRTEKSIELAAWAITALTPGGRAIVPQEPYGEGDQFLLPARSMALWQYTKMNDPRWIWGDRFIQAKQLMALTSEQKIGVLNKRGWAAYVLNQEIMIKQFVFDPNASYPDFNCNNEIYINGNFLEIETLSPLITLPPGGIIEHTERWKLAEAELNGDEDEIDSVILPLVNDIGEV